jgi:DNA-binding NarL/FixJ family response regulator
MTPGVSAQPIFSSPRMAPVFSSAERPVAASEEAARILIVEDDYLAAAEIEAALIEGGFEVAGVANSAEDAVTLAKSQRPSLTIMDIRLTSRRDGIEAALEIFKETGIRCIFATAHHDSHMRSRAQPAAPLGWLAKPYSMPALVALVKQSLAKLNT